MEPITVKGGGGQPAAIMGSVVNQIVYSSHDAMMLKQTEPKARYCTYNAYPGGELHANDCLLPEMKFPL